MPKTLQYNWWRCCMVLSLCMLFLHHTLAAIYYATPTLDTPCPDNSVPCMPLSDYAEKPVDYFDSNTTLVVLPGHHTLSRNLTLFGLNLVRIEALTDCSVLNASCAVITCAKLANINLLSIPSVHVRGLTTVGCSQNQFISIENFSLKDSNFMGLKENCGGIIISNSTEVLISGSMFSANTGYVSLPNYSCRGGAVVSVNNKYVRIEWSTFLNNSVSSSIAPSSEDDASSTYGGAVYAYRSTIEFESTTFSNNSASDKGGVLYAMNSTITFTNCTMGSNSAARGGVLYANVSTEIVILSSTFINNQAYYYGGVFESISELNVEINGCTFQNNVALLSGGAIFLFNSNTLNIFNSTFNGNLALADGVIFVVNVSKVVVHSSYFQHNRAKSAGVIAAQNIAMVSIYDSTFGNNRATQSGGAIEVTKNTTLEIHSSLFEFNKADYSSGVLYAQLNSKVTVNSTQFSNNTALFGGASFVTNFCTMLFNNCTFEDNTAIIDGGVVTAVGDVTVEVFGSSFCYNKALESGGVLVGLSNVMILIDESQFWYNRAQQGGGVVFASSATNLKISSSHFQYNTVEQGNGGVLYAQLNSVVSIITQNTFYGNKADSPYLGGVVFAEQFCTIDINDADFEHNTAASGGVIATANGTKATIHNSTFQYNQAETSGVIATTDGTAITIRKSHFQHNTATPVANNTLSTDLVIRGSGGVIGAQFNSNVGLYSNVFSNNTAGYGGVIFTQNSSFINIRNTTFEGNEATMDGGVMFCFNDVTVEIDDSRFLQNTGLHGGVIVSASNTSVILRLCSFCENRAEGLGGVVDVDFTSILSVLNCSFRRNSAPVGGCISVSNSSVASIHLSHFQWNKAENASGVLFANNNANISIDSCTCDSNSARTAGVLTALNHTTVYIFDSHFLHNKALLDTGGVFSIQFHSNVTIEWSIFYNNTADDNAISGDGGNGAVVSAIVSNVGFYHSSFDSNMAHYQGGVIFANSTTITVHNCTFQHNRAITSGGAILSINCTIGINSSIFYQNHADRGGSVLHVLNSSSSVMIRNSQFDSNSAALTGSGGCILCTRSPGKDFVAITFENLTFIHNSGGGFGGVLYLDECNLTSSRFLHIHNNFNYLGMGIAYFLQTTALFSGITNISNNIGSVIAFESTLAFNGVTSFLRGDSRVANDIVIVNGTSFLEAGAITLFNSALFLSGKTTLMFNLADDGGAIVAIDSTIHTSGDTVIAENNAVFSGGAIFSYQSGARFSGSVLFSNNFANRTGGGIHAIASTVRFANGTHHFTDNSAVNEGGALYLELNSKVFLIKSIKEDDDCSEELEKETPCIQNSTLWLKLDFTRNSADFGGAIFVKDSTNSDSCHSKVLVSTYSPSNECFFQTLQEYYSITRPSNTPIKNTYFNNNTAISAGNNLYGGLLDRCTLNPFVEYFGTGYTELVPFSYLQNVTNIQLNSISSLPLHVCFCDQTGSKNCGYYPSPFKVIKGQSFTISAVAVDQVNQSLPSATIRCSPSSQASGLAEGQTRQTTSESGNCTELNYTLLSPNSFENLNCYAEGPCNDLGISKVSLEVIFSPCPIGFSLTPTNSTCDCDPRLKPYITNCSISTGSLQRQGEFWITPVQFNLSEENDYVIFPHCPFDYCYPPNLPIFISLSNSTGVDGQCSFNHSGKLCGQCRPGLSLSLGSSHCRLCSNYWTLLLIPFTLAGIVLVAFILMLNLTVAIGTINGVVFYANIVAVNRDVYFAFDKPNFLTVFVSWLNLDFGFETCLYDGMDAYVKTWLQFVFPLYIMFLVAAIIIISDYSPRFASFFTGKNPVATLATLILLSFTKLLRTIIAALSFAELKYPDGTHELVWLLDANVPYLQGKHIPLFIAAVVTALVGLVYICVLSFWQLLLHCPRKIFLSKWMTNSKLLAFIDAYHAPFNKQHRYWTGMLLLLRTLLYLISAVNFAGDPRVNLVSIVCVMLFIFMHATLVQRPLKKFLLNLLECAHLFNLSIFTALTFYFKDSQGNQAALAYTSTSISGALFGVIVIYHTHTFTLKRQRKKLILFLQEYCGIRSTTQRRRLVFTNENELPNVVRDFEGQSKGVTVTEINALPSIHSTLDDESDSDDGEEYQPPTLEQGSESETSSEADESAPLLKTM